MLRRNLFLAIILVICILTGCKEKLVITRVKLPSIGTLQSIDGKHEFNFQSFSGDKWVGETDNMRFTLVERKGAKLQDIDIIPNERKYQGKNVSEVITTEGRLGKKSVNGIKLMYLYFSEYNQFLVVRKGIRRDGLTSFDIILIDSDAILVEDRCLNLAANLFSVAKTFDINYLVVDNFSIKFDQVRNSLGISSKAIQLGELWGIGSKNLLKKSKGYEILEGNSFNLKYKTGYDYSVDIEVE